MPCGALNDHFHRFGHPESGSFLNFGTVDIPIVPKVDHNIVAIVVAGIDGVVLLNHGDGSACQKGY